MALTIAIDGREVTVESGTTILEAAKKTGVHIPTLCHHQGIRPYKACQICRVEIEDEEGGRRVVAACTMPVRREGQKVYTQSQAALEGRRRALQSLLVRHPPVDWLWEMAQELGVSVPEFPAGPAPEGCILCGLCARACSDLLGIGAISYDRRLASGDGGLPLQVDASACVGCGACASVCPTGATEATDRDGWRRMDWWGRESAKIELQRCSACGEYFASAAAVARVRERAREPLPMSDFCPTCRALAARQRLALGIRT